MEVNSFEQPNRCHCGKIVKFQAVTSKLDEGFCSEDCLSKAMEEDPCLSNTPISTAPIIRES